MNTGITDVINDSSRLVYDTRFLRDEELRTLLIKGMQALGTLVEPDFVAQITQGEGISFKRIYCYELAIQCDLLITEAYKATKSVEQIEGFTPKTDALGNVDFVINKKTEKTHSSGTENYDYSKRVKGVRCVFHPNSVLNSYNALTLDELDEWLSGSDWTNNCEGFSSIAPVEYSDLPQINEFSEEIARAITSYYSVKLEADEASSKLASTILSLPHWSVDSINFSNAKITKCHASVARVGIIGYIACVSCGETTYNIVLDGEGNILLEKSLFPMPSYLSKEIPSNEEIHSLFISRLQQEGENIDPDFLAHASDINNIEIEITPTVNILSRTGIDLQASCFNEPTLTRPTGFFFTSAISLQGKPYKINSSEETNGILEDIKCGNYVISDRSLPIPFHNTPDLSKGVKLKATDNEFYNDRLELSKKFSETSYVSYSLIKTNQPGIAYLFSCSSCVIKVIYKGDLYQSIINFEPDTPEWNICYKQSSKIISEKVSILERRSKSTKLATSGIICIIISVALMALAIWQSISLWWLDRYNFINTGTQRIVINIFTWIRILLMFFISVGCWFELSDAKKAIALCEKHKKVSLYKKADIDHLDYFIKNNREFNANVTARDLLIWTILATVAFLIPFIIFIF